MSPRSATARRLSWTFGSLMAMGVALPALAQDSDSERGTEPKPAPSTPPASPESPESLYVPDWLDYDSERPYDFYERDWRYRMRTYRGQRFSRDFYRAWRRTPPPGAFGPYASDYYGPYGGYGYGPPAAWGYADPSSTFDEGYWQGERDGRRLAQWEQSVELGTASYLSGMRSGLAAFRQGDYATAVKQFILAANLNQGDAASRLHAAHAMVALGHYDEAAPSVRRAIQLQPQLVYLSIDIRADYGVQQDFDVHYAKLKAATEQQADHPDLWFLLGYYQFFSGRAQEAYSSLKKSDELAPGSRTTQRLLDAAKLSAPAEPPAPPPHPQEQVPAPEAGPSV
jgi:tetratricopeptide (TPR) repeat protein